MLRVYGIEDAMRGGANSQRERLATSVPALSNGVYPMRGGERGSTLNVDAAD